MGLMEDERRVIEEEIPERPYIYPCDLVQAQFLAELCAMVPNWIESCEINKMDMYITLRNPDCMEPFLEFMKEHAHCRFRMLSDLTCCDRLGRPLRFELIYFIRSVQFWNQITVHVHIDEQYHMPSICDVHFGADPMEREVYDMFGVFFKGHPDL